MEEAGKGDYCRSCLLGEQRCGGWGEVGEGSGVALRIIPLNIPEGGGKANLGGGRKKFAG